MRMANGHGKRIGGIVRLGDFRKVEDEPRHLLHLFFFRPAIAYHALLDLQGRVFINLQAALFAPRASKTPTRLANIDDCFCVAVEKKLFNRHRLRGIALHEKLRLIVNQLQPPAEGHACGRGNRAVIQKL